MLSNDAPRIAIGSQTPVTDSNTTENVHKMLNDGARDDLLRLIVDEGLNVYFFVKTPVVFAVLILFSIAVIWIFLKKFLGPWRTMEIDETELGVGNQKLRLKPNTLDQQIAYKIWVELTTRKIGLEIDLENDVIAEIYDSWYNFFSVTRDLIKDIPASKVQKKSTQKIIGLSIDVLNTGLRPHLTKWQARFRRWYNKKLEEHDYSDFSPQDIQKQYPNYDELTREMLELNQRLIKYRSRMYELVVGRES